eukprot:403355242
MSNQALNQTSNEQTNQKSDQLFLNPNLLSNMSTNNFDSNNSQFGYKTQMTFGQKQNQMSSYQNNGLSSNLHEQSTDINALNFQKKKVENQSMVNANQNCLEDEYDNEKRYDAKQSLSHITMRLSEFQFQPSSQEEANSQISSSGIFNEQSPFPKQDQFKENVMKSPIIGQSENSAFHRLNSKPDKFCQTPFGREPKRESGTFSTEFTTNPYSNSNRTSGVTNGNFSFLNRLPLSSLQEQKRLQSATDQGKKTNLFGGKVDQSNHSISPFKSRMSDQLNFESSPRGNKQFQKQSDIKQLSADAYQRKVQALRIQDLNVSDKKDNLQIPQVIAKNSYANIDQKFSQIFHEQANTQTQSPFLMKNQKNMQMYLKEIQNRKIYKSSQSNSTRTQGIKPQISDIIKNMQIPNKSLQSNQKQLSEQTSQKQSNFSSSNQSFKNQKIFSSEDARKQSLETVNSLVKKVFEGLSPIEEPTSSGSHLSYINEVSDGNKYDDDETESDLEDDFVSAKGDDMPATTAKALLYPDQNKENIHPFEEAKQKPKFNLFSQDISEELQNDPLYQEYQQEFSQDAKRSNPKMKQQYYSKMMDNLHGSIPVIGQKRQLNNLYSKQPTQPQHQNSFQQAMPKKVDYYEPSYRMILRNPRDQQVLNVIKLQDSDQNEQVYPIYQDVEVFTVGDLTKFDNNLQPSGGDEDLESDDDIVRGGIQSSLQDLRPLSMAVNQLHYVRSLKNFGKLEKVDGAKQYQSMINRHVQKNMLTSSTTPSMFANLKR